MSTTEETVAKGPDDDYECDGDILSKGCQTNTILTEVLHYVLDAKRELWTKKAYSSQDIKGLSAE